MSSQSETIPTAKRVRTTPPGLTDILQSTRQVHKRPNMKCFPPVKMDWRNRRFNKKYYTEHKWVELSAVLKRFCFPSRHYGKNSSAAWIRYVSSGDMSRSSSVSVQPMVLIYWG